MGSPAAAHALVFAAARAIARSTLGEGQKWDRLREQKHHQRQGKPAGIPRRHYAQYTLQPAKNFRSKL
jgi:hypothetical protein